MRIVVWTLVSIYATAFVLLRIPAVQEKVGSAISDALADKLGTKVVIGKVDIRLFNRVITDDVLIYDQQQKQMLRASRISAAIELLPLLHGEVNITSAQLFGMKANLYRNDSVSPLNCQFVIDSLSSKDTLSESNLNLSIASLIIRNGKIEYNQLDKPRARGGFSPYHIALEKLSSHIILYKLTNDSVNVLLKRLSFNEASGIVLNDLHAQVRYSKGKVLVDDFRLSMPGTSLEIPLMKASYDMEKSGIRPGSLAFEGRIGAEKIAPQDFSAFLPADVVRALPVMSLDISAKGTDKSASADVKINSLGNEGLVVLLNGKSYNLLENITGETAISKLHLSGQLLGTLQRNYDLPTMVGRLGDIDVKGLFQYLGKQNFRAKGDISASSIGTTQIDGEYKENGVKGTLKTNALNIQRLLDNKDFGTLKCDVGVKAGLNEKGKLTEMLLKGNIGEVTYKGYTYHDIKVDGEYSNETVKGMLDIHDPNIVLTAEGVAGFGRNVNVNATISLDDFCPKALNISKDFGDDRFSCDLAANLVGSSLDNVIGTISLSDFIINNEDSIKGGAYLDNITLTSAYGDGGSRVVELSSDFANLHMQGDFLLTKIPQSITNLIAEALPSLPGIRKMPANNNNFSIDAMVSNLDVAKRLFNIPIDFSQPIKLKGFVNSSDSRADITLSVPDLMTSGMQFSDTELQLWSSLGDMKGTLMTYVHDKNGKMMMTLDCTADNDNLNSALSWDNGRANLFRGRVNAMTHFYKSLTGNNAMEMSIPHSNFVVGDTIWSIKSDKIFYEDNRLAVNQLNIGNENQHLNLDGVVSKSLNDSLVVDLKDVNVAYIMNLINFHSVEFAGLASGTAVAKGALGDLQANGHLDVKDFLFQYGRLGTLSVDAAYSNETGRIELNGLADDQEVGGKLHINGYLSPKKGDIDLMFGLDNIRTEFMQDFCGSFMDDITLRASGYLRLHDTFKTINLSGKVAANGEFTLPATNCRYSLQNDTIVFVPNDIQFNDVRLKDRNGGVAYLNGGIHHRYLGRMRYDLSATTMRFLVYDFPNLNGNSFCGSATVNGDFSINGAGNELTISADVTPLSDSFVVYDASSPETITSQDFITWGSANNSTHRLSGENAKVLQDSINQVGNDRTNIRMNLLVNATPDMQLHLLMDATTGDYIDLFGNGTIRVSFYNKGGLELFGNYDIDRGTYKMTIQNLLRRDFTMQKGSVISFGGDPYNAVLNLKAAYMLNSVSLADLNIGSSFKANNVPVNCLMNISGTPFKPEVTFDLDLPSLSNDARNMVYSVINSAEEMNQQVLYLLGIGRFYSQMNQNENSERAYNQTSLAMQSFLSGTLTQQFNNVMSQIIGSRKWSFGANITPGTDGFNNAEYEGLLSGSLFNNRLIFNGQFGYRDNVQRNSQSFIGDFTLQYLITPNGNLSLKVYNQSNDRYFTRNSLNTQGIGVVFQKEFGK